MNNDSKNHVSMEESLSLQTESHEGAKKEVKKEIENMGRIPRYSDLVQFRSTSNLEFSTKLYYLQYKADTEKAILFQFYLNPEIGKAGDIWLPKKLCSNLDMKDRSFYLWTTFLEGKLEKLLVPSVLTSEFLS